MLMRGLRRFQRAWLVAGAVLAGPFLTVPAALAQFPDHPIITEAYPDPAGDNDGPVGRLPGNLHQEYIEIYLPTAAALRPGLNKDSLKLTFYEVEGDTTSSGYGLVNYRIDMPPFDLDASNGITPGAVARPTSGVVVLGWVDYVGNPPTGLAGTPSTRVALINGGVTSVSGFTFIAINGAQFGGTTNFPVPLAVSSIDMPGEASSGIIQNGSGVYLLVNRDLPGYVTLYDDENIPNGESADPSLPDNSVLQTSCLMDGFGPNDSSRFDVLDQPSSDNSNDNFANLPPGGAYSLLVCQLAETDGARPFAGVANGYARKFLNVRKTTETAATDDPVSDAVDRYFQVRNTGPFYPAPGATPATTTAPELSVADATQQMFSVLAGTTGRPGVWSANVGGNFGINLSIAAGASSNPSAATFAAGGGANGVLGLTSAVPTVAITVPTSAAHNAAAASTLTVNAVNSNGADPPVVGPTKMVQATATVLKPTSGQNAAGQPFQTTVFVAIQPVANTAAANELLSTSFGSFASTNFGGLAQDTRGFGSQLLNATTDISEPNVVLPMVEEFPDPNDPNGFLNDPGPPGRLNLFQTVATSAEVQSGADTYTSSLDSGTSTVRAIRLNTPDTLSFGGSFSPSEPIHFTEPNGFVGDLRSGLTQATTSRTFELAVIDTNVRYFTIETGATDDFGIVVEVATVEAGSTLLPGEFVFLSFSGGLQGADIDTLQVPASGTVLANLILLDLDNLHDVLGIRSIEAVYLIDAGDSAEADIIEAFSLNPDGVGTPPTITEHPVSQTVCAGASVSFTVVAGGTPPLSYQWRRNGANVAGATSSTYTIDPVNAGHAGTYDCVVSNAFGSATSNPATLSLITAPDGDGDGVADACDNCPSVSNPDQTDSDGDGIGDACESTCPADFDGNGVVDLGDLAILLANFGTPSGATDGDTDGDGDVDLSDLAVLLSAFGSPCP